MNKMNKSGHLNMTFLVATYNKPFSFLQNVIAPRLWVADQQSGTKVVDTLV